MNTTSRIGKIARLPHSIREQLNLRLHDNEPQKAILPWLNSLPETKAILSADFDGRPITKQNLSEWKQGGFRDWLLLYHASHFLQFLPSDVPRASSPASSTGVPPAEFSSTARPPESQPNILPLPKGEGWGEGEHDLRQPTPRDQYIASQTSHDLSNSAFSSGPDRVGPHSALTAKLLLWTQLQYTTMARHIDAETDPQRKWTALRQFANDISRLRRSTLADDFLQIQRDWFTLSQSNSTEKKELEFCKWLKRPDIADAIKNKRRGGITREQLRKIEEEDLYLTGPDNPSLDEHIARVRLAKELMARRKAKEAEAKRRPGDPVPEPPHIKLRDTTFEELFPTIPDQPLTELDLDNPSRRESVLSPAASTPSPQHAADSSPLPKGEGQGEGEGTVHQPSAQNLASSDSSDQPALRSSSSEVLLTKEDASGEGRPALRSAFGEGGSNPVQPSPTKSNRAPLDLSPNSNNDNPTPDN